LIEYHNLLIKFIDLLIEVGSVSTDIIEDRLHSYCWVFSRIVILYSKDYLSLKHNSRA